MLFMVMVDSLKIHPAANLPKLWMARDKYEEVSSFIEMRRNSHLEELDNNESIDVSVSSLLETAKKLLNECKSVTRSEKIDTLAQKIIECYDEALNLIEMDYFLNPKPSPMDDEAYVKKIREVYAGRGHAHFIQKDFVTAESYYNLVDEIFQFSDSPNYDKDYNYVSILKNLGQISLENGNVERAQVLFSDALEELDKTRPPNDITTNNIDNDNDNDDELETELTHLNSLLEIASKGVESLVLEEEMSFDDYIIQVKDLRAGRSVTDKRPLSLCPS